MNWLLLTRQEREEFGASHKANHCKLWETLRSKSLVCWGKFGNFYCLRIGDLEFSKSCITWEQGWGGWSGGEKGKTAQKTYSDLSFLACFAAAWENCVCREGDNRSTVAKNTAPATD